MTVLQKIIDELKLEFLQLGVYDDKNIRFAIKKLVAGLPAEEQQIRDAAAAGFNWRRHKGISTKEDIDDYIKSIKEKL